MTDAPLGLLAERLGAGETLFMSWCGFNDPAVAEATARAGFDATLIDMQHGAVDYTSTVLGVGLIGLAGKPALVRIPVGDFALCSRLLDAGAAGIVAPMINSVEDARRFAAHAKFPPVGERSWSPHRALALSGRNAAAYLGDANSLHVALAMIETRPALAALDEILDVDGIDGVLVGPADLSIALSHGESMNPTSDAVEAALDKVAQRCAAKGKVAAVFCPTGARAHALAHRGFRLCAVATDGLMLQAGARMELKAAKG